MYLYVSLSAPRPAPLMSPHGAAFLSEDPLPWTPLSGLCVY